MPTWKIGEYRFYFRAGEPLKKHEPAHVHVLASKGKIQFWLEEKDQEKQVKKIEGYVSPREKGKIRKIIEEKNEFFLKEWEKIKARTKN
jgi:hypothetical protein